jgi:two-component system, OmpR family, alkaline phosphatase synthesis response regulator PhoP
MEALIVVVEDEEDILELIEYSLGKEGFEVIGFLNTKNVSTVLQEEDVDLIIMDRNLPGVEGSEFINSMRKEGVDTPVIYLSAKNSDEQIEEGFLRGGDDYMTKPFNLKELVFRIKAILKRTKNLNEEGIIRYKDIELDLNSYSVKIEKEPVNLTKLEFNLLLTLIQNKNIVLSREFLLEHVWGIDDIYQDRTVNVAINRLKDKIDSTKSKEYIKSVRGVGYTLY